MFDPTSLALIGLCILFAKHFLVDFVLQSRYQLKNKGIYGHPGGILHSGLHSIFSLPGILLFTTAPVLVLSVCAVEFLIHYHMDWAKDHVVRHFGWTISDRAYWQAFGFDQFIHALTYLAMVAALLYFR